jgi:LmbE family N-acetylglucosaminyl deacetylase
VNRPLRLGAVFAHPDDDAYLIGGWLASHASDAEIRIVLCTSGGPARSAIRSSPRATRSPMCARGEEWRFLEQVGASHADVRFLRYPDYHLNEVPAEELTARVVDALEASAPQVLVTFGPDGMTNHHDHIAAGAAGTNAFHEIRGRSASIAFQRLYHVALPESSIQRFYRAIQEHHPEFGGRDDLFNPTGVPDDRIAVRVDARPVIARTLAGILAHATQLTELTRIPEDLRWIYLDDEAFVQAWPPRPDGARVTGDLFDGLAASAT